MSVEAINWHTFFFLLMALLACAFAIAVVVSGNIVRMAFYLIMSLAAVSGLFFLAGADFVGAMQLMIYVGGTLVLLIFGVMLTAGRPFFSLKTGAEGWVLAVILGASLLAVLIPTALRVSQWNGHDARPYPAPSAPATANAIGLGLVGVRVDQLEEQDKTLRAGMSGYLLPFEIVSIHLVVVLVGAAYLARARRRRPGGRDARCDENATELAENTLS